jgi:hypothetical protein
MRSAAESQEEGQERIDREFDRREFAGQIFAGRGVLLKGKLLPQVV